VCVCERESVIVLYKLLKRHFKAKHRAPAYSRALRQIRPIVGLNQGMIRSNFQRINLHFLLIMVSVYFKVVDLIKAYMECEPMFRLNTGTRRFKIDVTNGGRLFP